MQITSGVTPNVSAANICPVRPMPVMISSKISRTLCRSQISRRIGRYSSGGSMMPPVWPIGSTMIAATVAGSSISMTSLDERRAGDAAVGVALAERAAVAGRREDVEEARGQRLVDRLARLQARRRQRAQRRAVPRQVAADDLVLAGVAGELVVLPGQLDRRLGHLGAAALELDGRQVARRQLGEQVGQLHRDRVGAVHRRREVQRVELLADRLDHAAIVVADRDDVDARERVEVALAVRRPSSGRRRPGP